MSDFDSLLAANRAFYAAFAGRDMTRMEAVWSRSKVVTCIHPARPPLIGRAEVLKSWREIMTGPRAPHIGIQDERPLLNGDMAVVLCLELIGRVTLAATNIFVHEDGGWRMIHHQAGALAMPPRNETTPTRLH